VMPVVALEAVKETVPLNPLLPARLTLVDESLFPRDMVTLDWLRLTVKPVGAITTEKVDEWEITPQVQNPDPVAVTVTEPLVVPLTVAVSEPVVQHERSTEPWARVAVRPDVAVTVSLRMSL
jgi:hypothetical protein